MKMWSMNVMILLLFCYACLATGKDSVYFVSKNFHNVLHWAAVNPASPGQKVLYSVQYWSDAKDQKWQEKEECQNITGLSCDLTAETPSVHDVHYQARVRVNGTSYGRTTRIRPLAETILGAPILSNYTRGSSLYIDITLPLGPNGVSIEDIIAKSKSWSSKPILYTLNITHPQWPVEIQKSKTKQFIINLKKKQTKYCGNVVYKLSSEWGRPESESASFCVTLSDNTQLLQWLLVSAAVLAALVIISVVCMCNYVKSGKSKSMPQVLTTTSGSCKVLEILDRNRIISKIDVCTESDQTTYANIKGKADLPSVGFLGYSPNGIPFQAWQGSSGSSVGTGAGTITASPEDTSAQSSDIYSAVAVHVPAEENEVFQQATTEDRENSHATLCSSEDGWEREGMCSKLTSCGEPLLSDVTACEGCPASQLLLHTVRDSNGKLMLPLLSCQLQSNTSDTISPVNLERKPLLSDLIDSTDGPSLASLQCLDSSEWSDSGCDDSSVNTPTHPYCNSHYSPSQAVVPYFHQGCQGTPCSDAIFESGYKQNWMPTVPGGPTATEHCDYKRTNYAQNWTGIKMNGEGEENEGGGGVAISRQILLGNWKIQIQE
ncbi:interferon lambda receptor 1 [Amphiprion ocellaris]|uniref:interferon lambda receptor 1 n=1 Tax=Amphiprion ocellaris TaxID=80972 RepID=UPI0024111416|nr:interferon lambda receptor 1 [Amphiprion ocellaris]